MVQYREWEDYDWQGSVGAVSTISVILAPRSSKARRQSRSLNTVRVGVENEPWLTLGDSVVIRRISTDTETNMLETSRQRSQSVGGHGRSGGSEGENGG